MSNGSDHSSLLQSATRMIDALAAGGIQYDTLVHVLSLLCILAILHREPATAAAKTADAVSPSAAAPLHKILGELTKGDGGGPSADTLMSLLPLLNSPQLKSKLNPGNLASIMGLINTLGGSPHAAPEKPDAVKEKPEPAANPPAAAPPAPPAPPVAPVADAAAVAATAPPPPENTPAAETPAAEKKPPGRFLNWKTNF